MIKLLSFLLLIQTGLWAQDLQALINKAADGDTLYLREGTYEAHPSELIEEYCGNCGEHRTTVYGTKGFYINHKSLHIVGQSKEKVILRTNAGYGILFENSPNSSISNVTIGGGKRDTSGSATNGSIVVRFSKLVVENCILSNDTVRAKEPIVGVSGIVGREGSELIIRNNKIINNTWDGIALYRGAKAFIADNEIRTGRGVGIGVTWDAVAIILRNRVSGFWKGIGSFGTSDIVVKNNAIFDNLGWGLVITGDSHMLAENNVITRNGNCGIAPWSETATGVITNNIITENGWRKEWVCPQVGYWMNGDSTHFVFKYNDVWKNEMGDYKDIPTQTGKMGNVSVDPMFIGKFDFRIKENSPLKNSGNPSLTNLDGKQSDIGLTGGQSAEFIKQ